MPLPKIVEKLSNFPTKIKCPENFKIPRKKWAQDRTFDVGTILKNKETTPTDYLLSNDYDFQIEFDHCIIPDKIEYICCPDNCDDYKRFSIRVLLQGDNVESLLEHQITIREFTKEAYSFENNWTVSDEVAATVKYPIKITEIIDLHQNSYSKFQSCERYLNFSQNLDEFEKLTEATKIRVFGAKNQSIGHFSFVPFEILPRTFTSDTHLLNVECQIFNESNEPIYKIRPIFNYPLSKELYYPTRLKNSTFAKQHEESEEFLQMSIDPNEKDELIKNWNLDDDEDESDIGFVILKEDVSSELNVEGSIIFDGPWIDTNSGCENHINFKFPVNADKNLRLTIVMAMMAMHAKMIQRF